MKKLFREIVIIVAISVALGLAYNFRDVLPGFSNPKKLTLIRELREVEFANDSALFVLPNNPLPDTAKKMEVVADKKELPQKEITISPTKKQDSSKIALILPKEQTQEQHKTEEYKVLDVRYEQVVKLLKDPDVLFIDARNDQDFAGGHIGNSINVYAHEFEKHIAQILPLPRDKRIVIYCTGGNCDLSHELSENLKLFHFSRLFIYTGGWAEWQEKNK